MSDQFKMVPVVPTYEMDVAGSKAFSFDVKTVYSAMVAAAPDNRCHGEECTAGAWPSSAEHSKECLQEAAKSQGWPVPPPGDVEVLEVYGYQCRQSAQEKFFLHEYPHYWQHIPLVRQADAMERITRLTAERDGLLAEVTSLRAERDAAVSWQETVRNGSELLSQRDALQSKLTKALELNALLFEQARKRDELLKKVETECSGYPNSCPNNEGFGCDCNDRFATPIAHNVDESCGQDAEAAKGERT